jgi:hypothetical protein
MVALGCVAERACFEAKLGSGMPLVKIETREGRTAEAKKALLE